METAMLAALLQAFGSFASMSFNSMEADKSREFSSEPARYDRLVSMGVNPNVAMQSIVGGSSMPMSQPAQASMPGLGELLSGIIQQPSLQADVNFKESQAAFYKAQELYTNMQSYFMPLEFGQKQKLVAAQIMDLHSASWMNDALAKKYTNEAMTIVPLAGAELAKSFAECQNLVASAAAYIAQSDLFNSQSAYYGSLKTGQDIQNEVDEKTKQDRIDIIHDMKIIKDGLALDTEWQNIWRDYTFGMGLSGDFLTDLAILKAMGGEYADFADKALENSKNISASLYDAQVQNQLDNWGKNFLNGLSNAGQSFFEGAGFGATYSMRNSFGRGGRAAAKGAGNATRGSSKIGKNATSRFPSGDGTNEWQRKYFENVTRGID